MESRWSGGGGVGVLHEPSPRLDVCNHNSDGGIDNRLPLAISWQKKANKIKDNPTPEAPTQGSILISRVLKQCFLACF